VHQGLDEAFAFAVGSGGLGPGALGAQTQDLTGLPQGFGAVGAAVVREHPPALNPLTVKPGHSPDQEANRGGLLLIRQDLGVSQAGGIVDGHMGFFVARTSRAANAPIASDPVPDAIKPGQLFDVDVDHVARLRPLVSPYRHWWLQLFKAAQAKGFEGATDSGERQGQQACDATEGAALMAQGNGALQMLWLERPPLAAANTASIHQGGGTTHLNNLLGLHN
jgi:hypothetical protein